MISVTGVGPLYDVPVWIIFILIRNERLHMRLNLKMDQNLADVEHRTLGPLLNPLLLLQERNKEGIISILRQHLYGEVTLDVSADELLTLPDDVEISLVTKIHNGAHLSWDLIEGSRQGSQYLHVLDLFSNLGSGSQNEIS